VAIHYDIHMASNSKGRHQDGAWQEKSGSWYFSFRDKSGVLRQRRIGPSKGPEKLSLQERYDRKQTLLDEEFPTVAEKVQQENAGTKALLTVKMAGDSWLHYSQRRSRGPIGANTARIYAHYLTRWIYPAAGTVLLSELKSKNAKPIFDAMKEAQASSSVMNDVATILQQILWSIVDEDTYKPLYDWKLSLDRMDVPEVEEKEGRAFTGEQIESIRQRSSGQYKVLFGLLPATGVRIGEALAIEIDGDPEKITTLSKDCRVLYIRSIILQDGNRQLKPKTPAAVREVDIHPDMAKELSDFIGNRTSGFLFCTESGQPILYSNFIGNVFDPILYDREQPIMKRKGKGWIKVGVKKLPGVLGDKSQYQDKENGRTGYGAHSFRRFRATYTAVEGVPDIFRKFWLGHGKKTQTEDYEKAKQETAKRREWAEKVGLGFDLAVAKVTAIKTAGKTAKGGKAA
jgi:integrase